MVFCRHLLRCYDTCNSVDPVFVSKVDSPLLVLKALLPQERSNVLVGVLPRWGPYSSWSLDVSKSNAIAYMA